MTRNLSTRTLIPLTALLACGCASAPHYPRQGPVVLERSGPTIAVPYPPTLYADALELAAQDPRFVQEFGAPLPDAVKPIAPDSHLTAPKEPVLREAGSGTVVYSYYAGKVPGRLVIDYAFDPRTVVIHSMVCETGELEPLVVVE